jgi:5-methyltetrahydrofolate--homocysteine methyltransferase
VLPVDVPPLPIPIVGDCLNADGSREFKRLLLARDADGVVGLARRQMEAGATMLDVSVAVTGADGEAERMQWAVATLSRALDVPLMIDSADPIVLANSVAIPVSPPVLNSISLRHGTAAVAPVINAAASRHASVVGLVIDDEGLARTAERKLAVARSLYRLVVEDHGLPEDALWIDPLVFPVARAEHTDARETIEGIRLIKEALPGARLLAGISDAGFGLRGAIRAAVERAFLRHCVEAGLDVALANPIRLQRTTTEEEDGLADAVIRDGTAAALASLMTRLER